MKQTWKQSTRYAALKGKHELLMLHLSGNNLSMEGLHFDHAANDPGEFIE